jgi:hypothetical protein
MSFIRRNLPFLFRISGFSGFFPQIPEEGSRKKSLGFPGIRRKVSRKKLRLTSGIRRKAKAFPEKVGVGPKPNSQASLALLQEG